jgi:hypothetical protein
VNLTLNGARITKDEGCALTFTGAGNLLILEGKNSVKSDGGCPGIRVEEGTELTIKGGGSLKTRGGSNGAGIGGGDCAKSGTIIIESGDITAIGSGNGAGIGGGSCRDSGTIIITGGTITATGGADGGAGIGGSSDNGFDKILITGGTVNATGGEGGSGIGQGGNSSKIIRGGEITITGGIITAISGNGNKSGFGAGSGIGGGAYHTGGSITIEGGTIVAKGGSAGIGGIPQNNVEGEIIISGGTIVATGGAGIGGTNLHISDGDITATGGYGRPGIGIGCEDEKRMKSSIIIITGGTIVATGGDGSAGIGCSPWEAVGEINIYGGNITAIGGGPYTDEEGTEYGGGAGIGGAFHSYKGDTIIAGGIIKAIGGMESAGIGTGRGSGSAPIIISGGTVIAIGGACAAGIGGGRDSDTCYTEIIGKSLVYAIRGEGNADDIGAGDGGTRQGGFIIKDKAAVFLGTNKCVPPETNGHESKSLWNDTYPMIPVMNNGEQTIYGIAGTGESPWIDAQGGWFVVCNVQYDANGGEGVVPETAGPTHITVPVTVAGADGLTKEGYTFSCWNTKADSRGKSYLPGDVMTFSPLNREITLYAQWVKKDDGRISVSDGIRQ